jgi:predicted nuclease with TOPRIM domain
MKANGEARVEALKVELSALDEEFDNCRHDVLFGGTLSNKELLYKLSEKQQETRHKKEICETLEELEHKVDRGFDHISELLGVSVREKNSQVTVTDIIMDVETVLDTLMEEREKQTQSQVPGGALDSLSQNSRLQSTVGPEMHNRPAELEFVLLKYENPQTRLPYKLPSRAVEADDEEEDDFDDSDAWDRAFIKTRASQTSRKKLRGKGGSKAVLKKIA